MVNWILAIAGAWAKSWLFLAWSAFCLSAGATWALVVVAAELRRRGLLH